MMTIIVTIIDSISKTIVMIKTMIGNKEVITIVTFVSSSETIMT